MKTSTKPKGGSILKRLKTNLKSLGLIGPAKIHNKKAKRTKSEKEDRFEKLKALNEKPNPFELKVTKQKHQIMGKYVKGTTGKPGVTKLKGFENRKKTLLVDLQNKDKVGTFTDRRFGENDPNLSVEDKMLERFTKEKQKRAEKNKIFNLESDEEELTHFGQSLSTLNDISEHDPRLDDDNDDSSIRKDLVSLTHFGGFEEDKGRKKSYNEIVKEIIAKSKHHKYERQKAKEEDETIKRQLNIEFDDIRSLLFEGSAAFEKKTREEAKNNDETKENENKDKDEEYDKMVRELAFEQKAKPTDRLKTEEEIAHDNAILLEKLEKKRIRRMQGLDSDSDEDENETKSRNKKVKVPVGADSLDENFQLNDDADGSENEALVYKDGVLQNPGSITMDKKRKRTEVESDESSESEIESSDDDQESEESEGGSGSEDNEEELVELDEDLGRLECSDEDKIEELSENESDENSSSENEEKNSNNSEQVKTKEGTELPYLFEMPDSHKELIEILSNRSEQEQFVILQRIRVRYHTSIHPENKSKLISLFNILLFHITSISDSFFTDSSKINNLLSTIPKNEDSFPHQLISVAYLPHLIELTNQFPVECSTYVLAKLQKLQSSYLKKAINLQKSSHALISNSEWILIQIFCRLYPTSDLHHCIVSPIMLLLGQWLNGLFSRIASTKNTADEEIKSILLRDVTTGILICQMLYSFQKESFRYIPEAISFLTSISAMFMAKSFSSFPKLLCPLPSDISNLLISLDFQSQTFQSNQNSSFSLWNILSGKHFVLDETTKLKLLEVILSTLESYAKLYSIKELEAISTPSIVNQSADSLEDSAVPLTSIFVHAPSASGWPWTEVFDSVIEFLAVFKNAENSFIKQLFSRYHDSFKSIQTQIISSRLLKCKKLGYMNNNRVPLQIQKVKVQSLKMLAPKFEIGYNPDRHYDEDPNRAETRKMKALVTKEKKGAIRELKKDANFLAIEKSKQIRIKDEEYKKKMNRVYGILSAEQGEANSWARSKAKKHKK